MSYPTYNDLSAFNPDQQRELQQFVAYLQGYLSQQHKDDGSHGAITGDSITVTGNVSAGGTGTFTGTVTAGGPSNAGGSPGTLDENITLSRTLEVGGSVVHFAPTLKFGSDTSWLFQQMDRTSVATNADLTLAYGSGVLVFRRTSSAGAGTYSIFVPFNSVASATPTVNVTFSGSLTANTYAGGETGTWTPVLSFGGASVGITYAVNGQNGTYSKFGNVVTAEMRMVLTSKGTSVGAAVIAGLPYTANLNPLAHVDFGVGGSGLASTPYAAVSGTSLNLLHISAGVRTALADTNFTGTDDVRVSITYRV